MKRKIRRKCKCGCGAIVTLGRKYISGHNWFGKRHTDESKEKMSLAAQNMSAETKKKMSLAQMGNKNNLGYRHTKESRLKMSLVQMGNKNNLGHKCSEEKKLKISLAQIKCDPNYEYCDIWKSREYCKDIRKDYCENIDCKKISKRLCNHHIYLDKKRCAPNDIMTMCSSCHIILHRKLQQGTNEPADPKDFIIINRLDHVSYIHKKSRTIIKIRRGK